MGKEKRKTRLEKGKTGASGVFIGFSSFAACTEVGESTLSQFSGQGNLRCSPVYTGGDKVISILFKKIGQKKDGSTKAKALIEIKKFFQMNSKSKKEQATALQHLLFIYHAKLNYDDFSLVRCESLYAIAAAKNRLPKAWNALVEQEPEIMGMIWCCSCDPSSEVKIASQQLCELASKDVWWNGLWLYVSRILTYGRPKNLHQDIFASRNDDTFMTDSEREQLEERFERLVVTSIYGLTSWMKKFSEEDTFLYNSFVRNQMLWKLTTNSRSPIRRASYQLLCVMCQHAKSVVYGPIGSKSLPKHIPLILAQEKDATNIQSLFEVLLHYLKFGKSDEFKLIEVMKPVNKLLKRGCYSASPAHWGSIILPFLVLIEKGDLILDATRNMLAGRDATIGLADKLLVICYIAEICSFFLLRNDEENPMEPGICSSMAECWLDCTKIYLSTSGVTSISRSPDEKLRNMIGKALCRFDEVDGKLNCGFNRVKDLFWKEKLPLVLLPSTKEATYKRFNALIETVRESQRALLPMSHLTPLIGSKFQSLFDKLNANPDNVPNRSEYEFMEICIEICHHEDLFPPFGTRNPDSFITNNILRWLVIHCSQPEGCSTNGSIRLALCAFSLLRVSLHIIRSPHQQQVLWRTVLTEVIKSKCHLGTLTKGILIMCRTKGEDERKPAVKLVMGDTLDNFAAHIITDALLSSKINSNFEDFLQACVGQSTGIDCPLVSKNILLKWIEQLSSSEEAIYNQVAVNIILRAFLEMMFADYILSQGEKIKVLLITWRIGGESWSKFSSYLASGNELEQLHYSFTSIAASELKSTLISLIYYDCSDEKLSNLQGKIYTWSDRAFRWYRNNIFESDFDKFSNIGLGDIDIWESLAFDLKKSERLSWCVSNFLLAFEDESERFLLLFGDEQNEKRIHLFTSILIAISHNTNRRGNDFFISPFVRLFGDYKMFNHDLSEKCIRHYLDTLKKSFENPLSTKKIISSFSDFICEIFPAYHIMNCQEYLASAYKEGEIVWYVPNLDEDNCREKATIVKVHDDDFPDLYYTIHIKSHGMVQERQSVSERLRKLDFFLKQNRNVQYSKIEDKTQRENVSNTILDGIIFPVFSSLELEVTERLEAAAECCNLVLSQIGIFGRSGIGTKRYKLFQLFSTMQNQAVNFLNEGNLMQAASILHVLSLSFGYGDLTPESKCSIQFLNFNPEASLTSLVSCYDNSQLVHYFDECSLRWIIASMGFINSRQLLKAVLHVMLKILNQLSCTKESQWLLFLRGIVKMYQYRDEEKFGSVDINAVSVIIYNFANLWEPRPDVNGNLSGLNVKCDPWWYKPLDSLLNCSSQMENDVLGAACRRNTAHLISSLDVESKRWFSFRFLLCAAKVNHPLQYEVEKRLLEEETQSRLSHWQKNMTVEESEELEYDILTVFQWVPPKLMVEIENWIDDRSYFDSLVEETIISRMLCWLVFLECLDTAAVEDVRNRISFSSYGDKTGAVFFVLSSCLMFLDTVKYEQTVGTKITLKVDHMLTNKKYICAQDLAMAVLFHTIEVFPTLSRIWWEEDCPKAFSSSVSNFVQQKVAPETLKRELKRIREATMLGGLNVQGSLQSREITASYLQDECTLSIVIQIPANFPFRNVDVDGRKTLGIPESRFKRWSLQIRRIINNQDGTLLDALLLWKRNVEKEFEGVEPCPVCYSVLSVKTHDLPNLECNTCANRFHSSCLHKWFASSGKSQCVICQQPWSGTRLQ